LADFPVFSRRKGLPGLLSLTLVLGVLLVIWPSLSGSRRAAADEEPVVHLPIDQPAAPQFTPLKAIYR
jgi:hypothetical protein